MDDRSPIKLLLCARDVLTGIMLPWQLGGGHREMITGLRDELEAAASGAANDAIVLTLLNAAIKVAAEIADTSGGMPTVQDKMDRARLTLMCIQERAHDMLS